MSDLVRFHRAHGELCLRAGLLAAARRAYTAAAFAHLTERSHLTTGGSRV